jgi:hypothetical protein
MTLSSKVSTNAALDFDVIWQALQDHPESYVNFGEHWWTLKRMLADWAEENGASEDALLIRGGARPRHAVELEEHEVYQFLDEFSGVDDFLTWISYVNPRPVWDDAAGEEASIEDLEWEERFL